MSEDKQAYRFAEAYLEAGRPSTAAGIHAVFRMVENPADWHEAADVAADRVDITFSDGSYASIDLPDGGLKVGKNI